MYVQVEKIINFYNKHWKTSSTIKRNDENVRVIGKSFPDDEIYTMFACWWIECWRDCDELPTVIYCQKAAPDMIKSQTYLILLKTFIQEKVGELFS